MSKKTAPRSPRPRATPREFLGGLDPSNLVELLDERFHAKNSPYARLYQQSRAALLGQHGREAQDCAVLLDRVDLTGVVLDLTRQAGFIQGFEVCRSLLLGEVDFAALKGGAR